MVPLGRGAGGANPTRSVAAIICLLVVQHVGCYSPPVVRGTWSGTLTPVPRHGAATVSLAGFDVARGERVGKYQEVADRDVPALLVDRTWRAIPYDQLAPPRSGVRITGRMTFANVKAPTGSGWVCGPPPRGLWDSHLTCWVVQIDGVGAIQRVVPAGE